MINQSRAAETLNRAHYLGARGARSRVTVTIGGGDDPDCVMCFASPSSRFLPKTWAELSRWCIIRGVGSQHWRVAVDRLAIEWPTATTVVSYSDPAQGHTGALYRASGWLWAPTWHALRPPPSGLGTRGGKRQEVKHRWVYLLRPDDERAEVLRVRDAALRRRFPDAEYKEPTWKRGRAQVSSRAGAFQRWAKA